jgi:hypothetical protein
MNNPVDGTSRPKAPRQLVAYRRRQTSVCQFLDVSKHTGLGLETGLGQHHRNDDLATAIT